MKKFLLLITLAIITIATITGCSYDSGPRERCIIENKFTAFYENGTSYEYIIQYKSIATENEFYRIVLHSEYDNLVVGSECNVLKKVSP